MTKTNQMEQRARELLLSGDTLAAWMALNLHADAEGCCPSCGEPVARFEASRLTHARMCLDLQDDAARLLFLNDDDIAAAFDNNCQ